jgi:hypothetical protein
LDIHNQCQDINLEFPVYCIHGGKWHVAPDQKINGDAVMRNYLESDIGQDVLKGALVYRIQRGQYGKSNEFIQDKSKCIQLLVAWRIEHTKGPHVRALLVEHNKEFNWDEDKPKKLH